MHIDTKYNYPMSPYQLRVVIFGLSIEKTLLDDEAKAQKLISVKCAQFNLKCVI